MDTHFANLRAKIERIEADPRGAITLYQRVLRDYAGNRMLASEALFRIAECQRAIGDMEARKSYPDPLHEYQHGTH